MNKFLLKSLIILIVIFFVWTTFVPTDPFSKKEVLFKLDKGQGSKDIAFNLQKQGLVTWSSIFRLYVLTVGVSGNLQAGTYSLSSSMNIPQIAEKFANGDIVKEKITIIEGWSLKDIGFYFENKGIFQAEELYDEMPELEGYLFPDTYWIRKGASLEEIVEIMQNNLKKKLEPLMSIISEKGLNLKDVIIMASIIEKEVQTKEDKEIVSGIFWKRIKYGYPLQSCASIAYIKGIPQWRYSYEDTRIESPYNTYLNYGLPPGPISNPGLDSILAAINPKDNPYLYYLSTPEGETIYSRTLDEHNVATAKYLK
ncbi:MAG: endolytic transglycosylase MltG [Candidatus Nealsonbacteria bacterium]